MTGRSMRVNLSLWFFVLFAVALSLFLLAEFGLREWQRIRSADEHLLLLDQSIQRMVRSPDGLSSLFPERLQAMSRNHGAHISYWPDCDRPDRFQDYAGGFWTHKPILHGHHENPKAFPETMHLETQTLSAPYLGTQVRVLIRRLTTADSRLPDVCYHALVFQDAMPAMARSIWPWTLLLVFLLLGLTSVVVYLVLGRVFAHVRDVAELSKQISAKDLSLRLDESRAHGEFQDLMETLNGMLDRLEASFLQVQRFSGDVAHELKTPLTTLLGELDLALRRERTPEQYRQSLIRQQERLGSLVRLVDDLLLLSKLDEGTSTLKLEPVSLDDLALASCEALFSLASRKQVNLLLPEPTGFVVQGNPRLLERLLGNLLENAIKYSPSGGEVTLQVFEASGAVCIEVSDRGHGIAKEQQARVWDRFYRVDDSRSRKTGGFGLGLSLVQAIAKAHQAGITLESEAGQGTRIRLAFPR